jgi:hypothetical protein
MNHLNKQIEDQKKIYKRIEFSNSTSKSYLKEQDTMIGSTSKFIEEKKKESKQ